eukprot:10429237-Lingulodinium_polyedra.AAC.1
MPASRCKAPAHTPRRSRPRAARRRWCQTTSRTSSTRPRRSTTSNTRASTAGRTRPPKTGS